MNILIAEDDPVNMLLIQGVLKPLGQEITTARNGKEALARIHETVFDLFLFDVMMPDVDGFDLCRACRSDPRHRDVPILMITALAGKNDLVRAFEAGASDFVTKPFHATELQFRVKAHLQQRSLQHSMEKALRDLNVRVLEVENKQLELDAQEQRLAEAQRALAEAERAVAEMASHDGLTGLINRRKGWDLMLHEEEKSRRHRKTMGVALLDLDGFKLINESQGNEAGDEVLKSASLCLKQAVRGSDLVVRWSGQEFLVVLPETDLDGLALAAEKLRAAVQAHPWAVPGGVTVSMGTTLKNPDVAWNLVLKSAEEALLKAKSLGRNRVVSG